MADLSTLLYKLMPYAPGLSEHVATRFMLDAAKRFCRQTLVIQREYQVTATTADVTVPNPSGLALCGFTRVSSGGYTMWSRAEQAVDAVAGYNDYRNLPAVGQPRNLIVDGYNDFRLVPAPAAPMTLTVRSAVEPTTTDEVPDELVGRWYEAIVSGALSELLMHAGGAPYSNPSLATMHSSIYGAKVVEARIKVNTSDSRHGSRVIPPSFILR